MEGGGIDAQPHPCEGQRGGVTRRGWRRNGEKVPSSSSKRSVQIKGGKEKGKKKFYVESTVRQTITYIYLINFRIIFFTELIKTKSNLVGANKSNY